MKIELTEQEMMNIVSTLNEQEIKQYSSGEYRKWNVYKDYNDSIGDYNYKLEYRFDEKGNLKDTSSTKNEVNSQENISEGLHTANAVDKSGQTGSSDIHSQLKDEMQKDYDLPDEENRTEEDLERLR